MIYTFFLYNFILFSSTALLYIAEREKSAIGRILCLALAFLITTVPSAIRFEIGTDYPNYVVIFEELAAGGTSYVEPGFLLLNKAIHSLGLGYEWLFAVVAIFIHTFAFLAYPKKNKYIAHLFFMVLLYFATFNILRQMMAIVVIMYAFKLYMQQRNDFKFYIMVAFASLFHSMAIIFLFIPMANNRVTAGYLRHFSWTVIVLWALVFILGAPLVNILFTIMSSTLFLDYSGYVENVRYAQSTDIQTGLGVFLKAALYFYPLFFINKLIKSEKNNSLIFILLVSYVLSWAIQSHFLIFLRVAQAFEFSLILVALMVASNSFIPFRRLYLLTLFLFLFLLFNKSILDSHTDYKVTCSPGRLTPYVTVFNKDDSKRSSMINEMNCYL